MRILSRLFLQENFLKIKTEYFYATEFGEKYKLIDGKLYFWAEPGYGRDCLLKANEAFVF